MTLSSAQMSYKSEHKETRHGILPRDPNDLKRSSTALPLAVRHAERGEISHLWIEFAIVNFRFFTMQRSVHLCVILAAALTAVVADTPANCTFEDIRGSWIVNEGERSSESCIFCENYAGPTLYTFKLDLLFPNVVIDEFGNKGFWTIIYNQGFEVVINYRKYFAFSKYTKDPRGNVTSYCGEVLPGWSHDVLGKNWACYNAIKEKPVKPKLSFEEPSQLMGRNFKSDKKLIESINKKQNSWTATHYAYLEGMSLEDVVRRSGGLKSQIHSRPKPSPVSFHNGKFYGNLPEEFDWRNVSGVNYVSRVHNQGNCGSCYAFASLAMLESRLRIATRNKLELKFSEQDIVSCSEYSQGCEGGFPYLIAGKYAQDFGVVPEECLPYTAQDDSCSEKKCKRYYVANYYYVGGFFGGCNEDLMKIELVKNGPIAVAFEVYSDFQYYKSGIYHHTGLMPKRTIFNPFVLVNHAVLAVGFGVDAKSGEKYWIVKNSWGSDWGEGGYFKIRRGTNECGLESIAVAATPIP